MTSIRLLLCQLHDRSSALASQYSQLDTEIETELREEATYQQLSLGGCRVGSTDDHANPPRGREVP
jgi:hypothetical protein